MVCDTFQDTSTENNNNSSPQIASVTFHHNRHERKVYQVPTANCELRNCALHAEQGYLIIGWAKNKILDQELLRFWECTFFWPAAVGSTLDPPPPPSL